MTIEIESSDGVLATRALGFVVLALAAALIAQGASVRALGYRHRPDRERLSGARCWLVRDSQSR